MIMDHDEQEVEDVDVLSLDEDAEEESEDERVPRARPRYVTRRRRKSALYAGDYRQWKKAHDLLVEALILVAVTGCFWNLFVVRHRHVRARLGPNNPASLAVYDKIVKLRRFCLGCVCLAMAIFKFEQQLGTMTAEEAYCRLYNRPSQWRRIADFEDDNECYNLTGFYRDQPFLVNVVGCSGFVQCTSV
jgi:hypothetical protein